MGCFNGDSGGCSPASVESWIDLQKSCPKDPRDLIAYATLASIVGTYDFSGNYIDAGGWSATPVTIANPPVVSALEDDNHQMTADANQWNFQHLTWNSASAVAIPLRTLIFLRGGTKWQNRIYLNLGGTPITEIQLSFLNNATTRGGMQGQVPVIKWTGLNLTNDQELEVVLKQKGLFNMGLWAYDGANYSMFNMAWVAVA